MPDHTEPIRVHIETQYAVTLTAHNAADVKLLQRFESLLRDADRSVVLTLLLDLHERHRAPRAA